MSVVNPTQEHERKTTLIYNPELQQKSDLGKYLKQKRKVAAYARVSTELDAQQSSYEAQIEYYTDFIQRQDGWEFVNVYADEGISGTSYKKRDGFNQMIADAKAGKIDLILTKSISRFARNTVDALSITRELKSYGVEVRFEKENISSMDSQAELIFTIMSSIAQEESRSISENVRWGQQRNMEAGKFAVGWSHFLGYKKGENGLPEIVEEEAKIVREIYQLFLDGMTTNSIARKLTEDGIKSPGGKDKWSPSTVRSILTNEKYKGDARLQKTYVEDFLTKKVIVNKGERKQWYVQDSHDAIIKPEIFELVQEQMKIRFARGGRYYDSPFTGKVICGVCGCYYGHRLWHKTRKSQIEGWFCSHRYKNVTNCSSQMVEEDFLKQGFVIVCNRLLKHKANYTDQYRNELLPEITDVSTLKDKAETLIQERMTAIGEAEDLVQKQAHDASKGMEYGKRISELADKIKSLEQEIEDTQQEISDTRLRLSKLESYLECMSEMEGITDTFDTHIFARLVDSITVMENKGLVFSLRNDSKETVSAEEIDKAIQRLNGCKDI